MALDEVSDGKFDRYLKGLLKAGGFRAMFCAWCGCTVFLDGEQMPRRCFLCGGTTFTTDAPRKTPTLNDGDRIFLRYARIQAW